MVCTCIPWMKSPRAAPTSPWSQVLSGSVVACHREDAAGVEPMSDDSTPVVAVRKMFQMILDGKRCKEIAKHLNSEGYTTTGGAKWGR